MYNKTIVRIGFCDIQISAEKILWCNLELADSLWSVIDFIQLLCVGLW